MERQRSNTFKQLKRTPTAKAYQLVFVTLSIFAEFTLSETNGLYVNSAKVSMGERRDASLRSA